MHEAEGSLLCKSTNEMVGFVNEHVIMQIPYFNAPVYLENKTKIGKVDEILGAISDVHFSMICDEGWFFCFKMVIEQVLKHPLSNQVIRSILTL